MYVFSPCRHSLSLSLSVESSFCLFVSRTLNFIGFNRKKEPFLAAADSMFCRFLFLKLLSFLALTALVIHWILPCLFLEVTKENEQIFMVFSL